MELGSVGRGEVAVNTYEIEFRSGYSSQAIGETAMTTPTCRWIETRDGDGFARLLADRHYSRKTVGANLFVGPGEKLVLVTLNYDALFSWLLSRYRKDSQEGVECTIFRNESDTLSSQLIREAVEKAHEKWPGQRLFTYVADSKVRSINPGYYYHFNEEVRRCGNRSGTEIPRKQVALGRLDNQPLPASYDLS